MGMLFNACNVGQQKLQKTLKAKYLGTQGDQCKSLFHSRAKRLEGKKTISSFANYKVKKETKGGDVPLSGLPGIQHHKDMAEARAAKDPEDSQPLDGSSQRKRPTETPASKTLGSTSGFSSPIRGMK